MSNALSWTAGRAFQDARSGNTRLLWSSSRSVTHRRNATSSTSDKRQSSSPETPHVSLNAAKNQHVVKKVKRKEADKQFFADLLSSAATKRDAKAYLSRLKKPEKLLTRSEKPKQAPSSYSRPGVNLGNIFRTAASDRSPVFSQYRDEGMEGAQEEETIHAALVRITDIESMSDDVVDGIAMTLSQLSRLSMVPCVVLEFTANSRQIASWKNSSIQDADRLILAIDAHHEAGARRLDNLFTLSDQTELPEILLRKLLLRPLRRGQIPVVLPVAYSEDTHEATAVSANNALLALTRELAGLNMKPHSDCDRESEGEELKVMQNEVSLDRIILVDGQGGIPSTSVANLKHVFVNLEQEYRTVVSELAKMGDKDSSQQHFANLNLLREALRILPPSASGLITTPYDAANLNEEESNTDHISSVGTRKQKNALIHNLLTDKPLFSSSLPTGRLARNSNGHAPPVVSSTTFVKRGMPLIILPDPGQAPWTADNHGQPRLKLTDPRIDLDRLVNLIDDSFNRKLDVEHYLNRVNDRIAGVIIAGEYEGGAILTWESPPGTSDTSRLVPYLDKFAVLKRSQGAGGVADIVFNAMVRDCFPNGVCWRSRKDNPVNKWYFERSRGTWKIPDMNWTMFWTTPEATATPHEQLILDYEAVCRGVEPSWADKKKAAD